MSIFSLGPAKRTPHHEPGYNEPDYVEEYNATTRDLIKGEHRPVLDYINRQMQGRDHGDLLDIGSGPGWISIHLAKRHPGLRITGVDLSPQFVETANQNKEREGVGEQITFTEGDAATLAGIDDQSMDLVISHQSLHYWDPPQTVFNQISRVLRPGGVFCISDDRRDLSWLGRLEVIVGSRRISKRIGKSWRRSVSGCFSSQEVTQSLQDSALRDRWTMSLGARSMVITSR